MQTELKNFTIRTAESTDVALIMSFIKELAAYEKMENEVVATEESLRESLFGEKRRAEVLFGEWEGKPVAFVIFYYNFSSFMGRPGIYLEDIYVKPEMRGRGIGKLLLSCLAHLAEGSKCSRLEWRVLNWNKPAINFYGSLGAVPMSEWTLQRLTGEALKNLAGEFESP